MKGTPMSLWLSAASRTAGWWQGHFANAWRQQSSKAIRAALSAPAAPSSAARTRRQAQEARLPLSVRPAAGPHGRPHRSDRHAARAHHTSGIRGVPEPPGGLASGTR